MRVLLEDARALGWCNRGLRDAAKQLGLDWTTFVCEGYAEEVLAELDNSMVDQIIAQARKRVNGS